MTDTLESPWLRRFAALELAAGCLVLVASLLLYVAWRTDTSGHGEKAFFWLVAAFLAPTGAALALAGWALRRDRRIGLWLQLAVPVAILATWVWFARSFGGG